MLGLSPFKTIYIFMKGYFILTRMLTRMAHSSHFIQTCQSGSFNRALKVVCLGDFVLFGSNYLKLKLSTNVPLSYTKCLIYQCTCRTLQGRYQVNFRREINHNQRFPRNKVINLNKLTQLYPLSS